MDLIGTKRTMGSMKKIFTPKQKAAVAIEAVKGIKTTSQIAGEYEVHPTQIGLWKHALLKRADELFTGTRKKEDGDHQNLIDRLYKTIGQRDVELEWLKKKLYLDA
jgi:transposase